MSSVIDSLEADLKENKEKKDEIEAKLALERSSFVLVEGLATPNRSPILPLRRYSPVSPISSPPSLYRRHGSNSTPGSKRRSLSRSRSAGSVDLNQEQQNYVTNLANSLLSIRGDSGCLDASVSDFGSESSEPLSHLDLGSPRAVQVSSSAVELSMPAINLEQPVLPVVQQPAAEVEIIQSVANPTSIPAEPEPEPMVIAIIPPEPVVEPIPAPVVEQPSPLLVWSPSAKYSSPRQEADAINRTPSSLVTIDARRRLLSLYGC